MYVYFKKINMKTIIFISMSFKHELSYQDFVFLISEIRTKIEGTDNDGSSSPPTHKYLSFKSSLIFIFFFFFYIYKLLTLRYLLICRFFNVMMPENLSDEIRVLNEYGGNMFDSDIDSDLRKLLD